jgi:hypothetical protein
MAARSMVGVRARGARVRALVPEDAGALWHRFHGELALPSPLAFSGIARFAARIGVVAERDGELIGLAIGRPGEGRAEVLALVVAPEEDADAVGAALLQGLLARGAFRGAREISARRDEAPLAARLLAAIGEALAHTPQHRAEVGNEIAS